jgi:hypothetical protein
MNMKKTVSDVVWHWLKQKKIDATANERHKRTEIQRERE